MSFDIKNALYKIVYIPLLLLFLLPAGYLLSSAYSASMQPGDDCSFVGLFIALGVILSACAGVILLDLFSTGLYLRTEKKIFAFISMVIDFVLSGVSAIIGIELLSDSSPVGMKIAFLAVAVACAACAVVNVGRLVRK